MKLRALAVAASLVAAHSAANAFFFFFLPLGAIQSAVEGGHCVAATDKPGDTITRQGRQFLVKSTSGVSSRCNQYPQWPVIAKIEPILTEAEQKAEIQACFANGVSVGTRTSLPNVGEVEVVSIGGNDCSDQWKPVSARVVRVQAIEGARKQAQEPPKMVPVSEPTKIEAKPVVDRLRELKQLRDENLITQEVYESKQRDILSGQ